MTHQSSCPACGMPTDTPYHDELWRVRYVNTSTEYDACGGTPEQAAVQFAATLHHNPYLYKVVLELELAPRGTADWVRVDVAVDFVPKLTPRRVARSRATR